MMRKTSLKNTAYAGEVNPCQSLGVLTRNLLNCFGLGVDLSNAEVLVLKPFHPLCQRLALDNLFNGLE